MTTEHSQSTSNQRRACSRRHFLQTAATGAFGFSAGLHALAGQDSNTLTTIVSAQTRGAKVAIVPCKTYGPEVKAALQKSLDLLGGIGTLVRGQTVTVKVNLTGTDFSPVFGRPPGESFMTHFSTALALAALLGENGARRIRFVESTNSKASLETTLGFADWDLGALRAHGNIVFENTRNLGSGKSYPTLKVPGGGRFFTAIDVNEAYEQTDVMVSLTKLKTHVTAGVTLSMKNLFGITPNALYGDDAGNEDAIAGRGPLHGIGMRQYPQRFRNVRLPHLNASFRSKDPGLRIPRIITDICAARPIHLAIIDGITAMDGAEGPWCDQGELRLAHPGVLIAGLNPVSTDAVGTAVMGFSNPRAPRGQPPFDLCDNHLLLAEQADLGTADLARIELLGVPIAAVVQRYRSPFGGA
jgi:uncharacterized protein (DUF362 family)